MNKPSHLFTRRLLPSLIAGVVATTANGAGDEVINSALLGTQSFINDSTSITVQVGGSVTSTGLDAGILLDNAGGHNLTAINIDDRAIVFAGSAVVDTGGGIVTIGSITIAGDTFSVPEPVGVGVGIGVNTTVTNDVIYTDTGSFLGSGAISCDGQNSNFGDGSPINCSVVQAGVTVFGTVGGNVVNQGEIEASNGLSVAAIDAGAAGSLVGDLVNSGTITVDGNAGLLVLGGASVGGNVENSGDIVALGGEVRGIEITSEVIAANFDDLIAGTAQAVVMGSVLNSGTIIGQFDGIAIYDDVLIGGDVINSGLIDVSGVLDGDSAAILIGDNDDIVGGLPTIMGSVINSGTLINNTTLDIEPVATRIATVELDGSFNGFFNNAGAVITNLDQQGTAVHSYRSTDMITNQGTINGAVRLGGGTLMNTGGTINGSVHYTGTGANINNSGTIISANTGVLVDRGTLSGSITNGAGATIDGANGGIVALLSTVTGAITNNGIINSLGPNGPAMNNAYGVDIQGSSVGSVDNNGSITGGLILEDVTIAGGVTNNGTIQSATAGGDAVVIRGTTDVSTITNTSILSGEGGILAEGGAAIGSIINDGVITGTSGVAIAAIQGGTLGSIINGGSINGSVDFGDDPGSVDDGGNPLVSRMVENSGFISGTVDFGSVGGTFHALGGSSGEIVGATEIIVDSGEFGVNGVSINGNLTYSGLLTVRAATEQDQGFTRNGQLNVSGDVDVTGATVRVELDSGSITMQGDEFSFLSAGGTLASDITTADGDTFVEVESGSSVVGFTVEQRDQQLFAVAGESNFGAPIGDFLVQAGMDETVEGSNVGNVADALTVIVNTPELVAQATDELAEAIVNLQGNDLNDTQKALGITSLDPETVEATSIGAQAADTAAAGSVLNRLIALRGDYGISGAVAGDAFSIHGFWLQAYANETDQDMRDGVDGFDADSEGVAVGFDSPITEKINLGLALSFATTDVDGKLEANEMSIDSVRLALYGSYNADSYYIDGQLAYATNEYDTVRAIDPNLTAIAQIANGSHDGDQYSLRIRAGYPIAMQSGWFITPKVEINYTQLTEDSYTEKDAGTLSLNVSTDDVEVFVIGLGVKVAYPMTTANDQVWIPELSLDYLYDTIGDEVEIDSNFIGVSGAGFITQGANTEQEMIRASLRMRTFGQGNWSFSAGFDYIQKDDYESQSVMATARYDF